MCRYDIIDTSRLSFEKTPKPPSSDHFYESVRRSGSATALYKAHAMHVGSLQTSSTPLPGYLALNLQVVERTSDGDGLLWVGLQMGKRGGLKGVQGYVDVRTAV